MKKMKFVQKVRVEKSKDGKDIPIYRVSQAQKPFVHKGEIKRVKM